MMISKTSENSIIDSAGELWRRRKWLITVCFLLVFTAVAGLVAGLPSLYRSSTTLLFSEDGMAESMVTPKLEEDLELRLAAIREAVMSRDQLKTVVDSFDLYPQMRPRAPSELVIEQFRKDIGIEQEASTEPRWDKNSAFIITISYRHWDPVIASQVANALAARFRAENTKMRTAQATRVSDFIGRQMETARQELLAKEQRMSAFRSEHLTELPEQQYYYVANLERLNDELKRNNEKRNELLRLRYGLPLGADAVKTTPYTSGLAGRLRLERLKQDLKGMQARYTAAHPQVVRLENEIAQLTQTLADQPDSATGSIATAQDRENSVATDPDLVDLRRGESKLRAEIAAVRAKIETMPKINQQLEQFTFDYDAAKKAYLSLQATYQNAQLAESLGTGQDQQFRVIEAAVPAAFPAAPNRFALIAVGFAAALGFALLAALVVERFDHSFHSLADIRRFTNVPVLASISTIPVPGQVWRRRTRFLLASVCVIAGLLIVGGASNYVGKHAQPVVLRVSN